MGSLRRGSLRRGNARLAWLATCMRTVALIPVRGGSKGIPGKNIKLLGGRPLLHWTLEAACQATGIDAVFVSSDSEEILRSAVAFGHPKVQTLVRPAELATDGASTEAAMLHFANQVEFERMLLIQATSPLTRQEELDEALRYFDASGADSLLSVTHEHRFLWRKVGQHFVEPQNYQPAFRPRRQDWSGELVENGAFYICSRRGLLESGCRLHGKTTYFVMRGHTAVEIDTADDWEILESLIARHRSQRRSPPRDIRLLVTDVDGVLTDAGMYYGPDGEALKKFSTRDGMGSQHWREAGRTLAIITGENSPAVAKRAEKLQIEHVYLGVKDKLSVLMTLSEKLGVTLDQVAYIGDDVNDLAAMGVVGFVACPADAHPRVLAVAHKVCKATGGSGCLRELIDYLLEG